MITINTIGEIQLISEDRDVLKSEANCEVSHLLLITAALDFHS